MTKLLFTDAYVYLGIEPALSPEELELLSSPEAYFLDGTAPLAPKGIEIFDDGSMDVAFAHEVFPGEAGIRDYARYAASILGGCIVNAEVYLVGPGSVASQAQGAQPQW